MGEENEVEVIGNWFDGLPDTVQAWDEVKTAKDADGFWDQMSNQRSLIGRSIQVPGEDASVESRQAYVQKMLGKTPEVMMRPNDEAMDEFYNSMGRPESADKYTPPELEGVEFDPASLAAFAPLAHKAGLTNKQFQQMTTAMQQNQTQNQQQFETERGEGLQALKGEWGMAFDSRVAAAQDYVNKMLPSIGDISKLPASSVNELFEASKSIGAEGAQMTQESGASAVMTPAEAEQTINEILSNQEHAYWNPAHPGHKAAKDRVIKLHEYKRKGLTG